MKRSGTYIMQRPPLHEQLAYWLRMLRVLSRTEFKLKYAGSVLGYVWSVVKPLLYFAVLWIVFGHLFRSTVPRFPLYLLIGIVLYTFLLDAVSLTLPSIVGRGTVLRRIAFPSLVIPVSTTLTAATTFLLNCLVVVVFLAAGGVVPQLTWLLLVPLFLEFYAFVLGLALICASLYVRFRDVSQIWEVLTNVLLFTTPIMYPMSILPFWAQKLVSCDPLVQVVQDARRLIFNGNVPVTAILTTAEPRVIPVAVAFGMLCSGLWLHTRESGRFPEVA